MIYHVVLFKFLPLTEEQTRDLYSGLECLRDIPGVISVQYGRADKMPYKTYNDRSRGYTHSLIVAVRNRKTLEEYEMNSVHNLVRAKAIKPLIDTDADAPVLAFDFEGAVQEYSWWKTYSKYFSTKTLIGFSTVLLFVAAGIRFRKHI